MFLWLSTSDSSRSSERWSFLFGLVVLSRLPKVITMNQGKYLPPDHLNRLISYAGIQRQLPPQA